MLCRIHSAGVVCAFALMFGWGAEFGSAAGLADDRHFDETKRTTLFAFDETSIPFTQNLKLEMREPKRHPANPVVKRGEPGKPDSWAVQFYGSILRENGKLRMWYVAAGDDRLDSTAAPSSPWRVAYAESTDGVTWTKPNLGLVEYAGDKNNNLVLMQPHIGTLNVKVIHDPDDPDPSRRYKMGCHVWFQKNEVRLGSFAPYASPDGFTWTLLADVKPEKSQLREQDLVIPALHFEPVGGLYKWDGLFYLSGQNAIVHSRPYHGRVTRGFVSPDFVNWSQASAVGFVRTPQHTLLGPGRSLEGEQTHEGVAVWNRGNVLVGVSGLWHGANEWPNITIDLGLVYSTDGVQFREPLHEHTFLKRGEDGQWDQGGLLQAQGFENIGEQTFVYYGTWDPRHWQGSPPRGGVGIAVLPRDRFADLVVDQTTQGQGNYQMPKIDCEFLTASIPLQNAPDPKFYVNADGLGDAAALRIELLDHRMKPLPGYSGDDAAIVRTSGFQTPIIWKAASNEKLPERVRFKVTFEGKQRTAVRFSAIYLN